MFTDNVLSIDLEFWHSGEPFSEYLHSPIEDQVEAATEPLLNLLKRNNIHATFFILGEVAVKYPDLIKKIHEDGHEIASHGFNHRRLHLSDKTTFTNDILQSIKILTSITKERPIGYRAPSFSLDNSTIWALNILKSQGFLYDSSVYPVKMRFYGESRIPLGPYHPSSIDITKIDNSNPFFEFPISVFRFGNKHLPISGGFGLRIIPTQFLILTFRKINQERPVLVYIHPWELYAGTPKLDLPFWWRFTSYYNIDRFLCKLGYIIKHAHFTTIRESLCL
jgi:polysaccharide deacetylase family protein (PEP-CTERM system associated)